VTKKPVNQSELEQEPFEQEEIESEQLSDEEWLEGIRDISNSSHTCAKTSIKSFEHFCISQGSTKEEMIKKYQNWINQTKPDVRSICISLGKLVSFMGKDHEEIHISENATFKKKTPKTIRVYLGFLKTYLRICHDVRLTSDDFKDYVKFPKHSKEPRRPISLKILKLLFGKCDPTRRALYYVLISSGMRLGEGLSLKPSNFHLDENPVRVTILAEDTKTLEGRETYISAEAFERIKPIIETKKDNKYIFHTYDKISNAVMNECKYFHRLRDKLGLTEKYPNSVRAVTSIHAMRAYFHTKASMKHGDEYANALDGHSGYLKVYYRLDDKTRAKMYKELEPELLIESVKVEADLIQQNTISELQKNMKKLQDKIELMELISS